MVFRIQKLAFKQAIWLPKNKSTLVPLTMLSREIQNSFGSKDQTIELFFDLEKSYGTTWTTGILKQLASWRIGGRIFHFIRDFLTNRSFKVGVGSQFSDSFIQVEGVPPGQHYECHSLCCCYKQHYGKGAFWCPWVTLCR